MNGRKSRIPRKAKTSQQLASMSIIYRKLVKRFQFSLKMKSSMDQLRKSSMPVNSQSQMELILIGELLKLSPSLLSLTKVTTLESQDRML